MSDAPGLPKINSLQLAQDYLGVHQIPPNLYIDMENMFFDTSFYVLSNPTMAWGTVDGLTTDMFDQFYCTAELTEQNFWLSREATRLYMGHYKPSPIAVHMRRLLINTGRKYWYHFPHQSINDPASIAFTPNHQYGLADRQVTMRIGKYLKKFYGDVLDDDLIRDLANLGKEREVLFAHGEDILRVYEHGPQSCMKGCDHAVRAYTYQHPDGTNEWAVAHMMGVIGDAKNIITARALVNQRHRFYPRYYGDDGPILGTMLESMGYCKTEGFIQMRIGHRFETRLLVCPKSGYNDRWYVPYLDGIGDIYGPLMDDKGVHYWRWGGLDGQQCDEKHYLDGQRANGIVTADDTGDGNGDDDGDNNTSCDICDGRVHRDDTCFSEYHHQTICDDCTSSFRYAYYSRHNDQTYVHEDSCVQCESTATWYLNESAVLDWHDVGFDHDGNLYPSDELVALHNSSDLAHLDSETLLLMGWDSDENNVYEFTSNVDFDEIVGAVMPADTVDDPNYTDEILWHHTDYVPAHQFADKFTDVRPIKEWAGVPEQHEAIRSYIAHRWMSANLIEDGMAETRAAAAAQTSLALEPE
jgi:hypothetical protein